MKNDSNAQQQSAPLVFDGSLLAAELRARAEELRRQLAERRAECLRIEGRIVETDYWLTLVQAAQPVDAADVARSSAHDEGAGTEAAKGE